MEDKPTVREAAQTVLSHCDGAVTKDGVGFNGQDTHFVRSLLEQDSWTFKQESALHRLLRKYIRQLSNYGVDYNTITKPVEKVKPGRANEGTGPMILDYTNFRLALHSPISFREQAKAIPTAKWNPDNKTWTYLARPEVYAALEPYITSGRVEPSVDARTALAGALTASQQVSTVAALKIDSSQKIDLPVKTKPYDHQDVAFQIGIAADQTALLMEQGTGKTLSAIATAGYRYNQGQIKKLLIVAPLSVSYVWESEFIKHADFEYSLVNLASVKTKKRDKKFAELGSGLQVAVINYESSWRYIDRLTKWNPDMIIADESQKIKDGRAKQSKGLFKLGDSVKYKMILTGTPITQGPLDTWSQYRFLNPDIFGRKFTAFRSRYAIMESLRGRPEIRLVVGYKNLEELAARAHSIAYRVTKAEALDLPPTIDQNIMVELPEKTQKIYRQMEKDFLVEFSKESVALAPIILTQLLRLQQITGGFLPTEDGKMMNLDNPKIPAVKDILEDLPHKEKVVIFARFTAEIKAIAEVSRSIGRKTLVLDGSTKNRGEVIRSFQEDAEVKVIVIQIQAGGLGITLTAASTAIFYSTTFSFADYEQAKARLHRIGQHHPVTYIHLLASGTIDEHVLDILTGKGDMARLIVDSLKNHNFIPRPFTNPEKSFILGNMKTITDKKEVKTRNCSKEGGNEIKKEEQLIALDSRAKGGWWYDEETKGILRKDTDGAIYYLKKNIETLEEAQAIVNKLNKKSEGEETIVSKKSVKEEPKVETKKEGRQRRAQERADAGVKTPAKAIEATAEEIEEEVEVEEDTPPEAPAKESKKAKRIRIKAEAEAAEKAAKAEKKTGKDKKAEKKADTKPAAKPAVDEDAVGAKELADMVNMDPKALRKVLREEFPDHEPKAQWTWKRGSKELTALVKKLNK